MLALSRDEWIKWVMFVLEECTKFAAPQSRIVGGHVVEVLWCYVVSFQHFKLRNIEDLNQVNIRIIHILIHI